MGSEPLVSVVVPCFNRERLIGDALRSCLSQTYRAWECIVVDDGSSDDSVTVVAALQEQDERIQLIERDGPPKGAATCRNLGLGKARGEYVLFLDSDDLLAPYCLEGRVAALEGEKDRDFVVFPMMYFVHRPLDRTELVAREGQGDHLTRFLRYDFPWTVSGPLWRRDEIFEYLRGFNEEAVGGGQDWELHVRALVSGMKYAVVGDALPDCFLRAHGGPRISKTVSKEVIESRKRLYEETLDYILERVVLNEEQRLGFTGVYLQMVCEPLLALDRNAAVDSLRSFGQRVGVGEGQVRRAERFLAIPWETLPLPVARRAARRVMAGSLLPAWTRVCHAAKDDMGRIRQKAMEAGLGGVAWEGSESP